METGLQCIRRQLIGLMHELGIIDPSMPTPDGSLNIFELGLIDSMGAVQLIELVSSRFEVEIDPGMLVAEFNSIDALCTYILKNGAVRTG